MYKPRTVLIAGHFNPVHVGHLNLIRDAKTYGDKLVVVVCNDYQAGLKRAKVFLPAPDRAAIMASINGVDAVHIASDTTTHIAETLRRLHPDVFANGCNEGHPDLLEEQKVCDELGIEVVHNVGGPKIRNSSEILKNYAE